MTTNYARLFWKYILPLALTTTYATVLAEEDISFTCDPSGKITSISKTGIPDSRIVIQTAPDSYCHYSDPTCKNANTKSNLHVIIQADTRLNLFASGNGSDKNIHYNLKCKDEYEVTGVAVGFTVSPATKVAPTPESHTFKEAPPLSLRIVRKDTSPNLTGTVYIGEELTLLMSSDAGYTVFPKKCTAINGNNDNDKVDIWTHLSGTSDGTCSTFDPAITTDKWKSHINKTVSISIYAFQFTTSTKVKINCAAHLCPTVTDLHCSASCLETRRRRRRQIMNGKQQVTRTEEAQVSFEVVSENRVHNHVNQANGVFVSFPVLITAVMFGERLSRFL